MGCRLISLFINGLCLSRLIIQFYLIFIIVGFVESREYSLAFRQEFTAAAAQTVFFTTAAPAAVASLLVLPLGIPNKDTNEHGKHGAIKHNNADSCINAKGLKRNKSGRSTNEESNHVGSGSNGDTGTGVRHCFTEAFLNSLVDVSLI
jgi:hypothetical protein